MLFAQYVAVEEYLDRQRTAGLGVALIDPKGSILAPYVSLLDYPDLRTSQVVLTGHDACLLDGRFRLHALVLHSGQLELDYEHRQPYRPAA
jgi:hypothetical protein